jgi:hypothetical protein
MPTIRWQRWPAVRATRAVDRPRCLVAVVALLSVLVACRAPGVDAQVGTPPAHLDVPTPAECTVAPRPADELRALFRQTAATPLPTSLEASPAPAGAPAGPPADEQTVAEIDAAWHMLLACINSGDQARMFALFSDDMVRRQFVVDIAFGVTEDALFSYLNATPTPIQPEQLVPFTPFTDVRTLGDGRVAAIGPGEHGRGDVRIFVRDDGRWLLDDWFDLN